MQRFRALVDTHRDRVYSLAFYLLGRREEAEDVTQEVLLRLWQNLESLSDARVGPWLMRVTRNASIDAQRKRSVMTRMMDMNSEGFDYEVAKSDTVAPDAASEAADFQRHLRESLASLPEPHRSIVVYREISDLKYREISEILDLPLNTVKVYLHRARRILRDEMRKRLDYVHG